MNDEVILKFGADLSGVSRGLRSLKGMLNDAAKSNVGAELFGALRGGLATIGLGFGAEKMFEGIKAAGELAEKVESLAESYGTSTKFVQQWEYAAEKSNSSAEEADKVLKKLVETIGKARDGDEEAAAKLAKHGIALEDVNGKAKSTEQIFVAVREHILGTADATESAGRAADLLGDRIGSKLLPALRDYEELKAKSENKILTDGELSILHNAGEQIKDIEVALKRFGGKALAAALKVFTASDADIQEMKRKLLEPPAEESKTNQKQTEAAKEYAKALEELRKAKNTQNVTDPYLKALIEEKDAAKALQATKEGTLERLKAEKTFIEKHNDLLKEQHSLEKDAERDKEKAREKQKQEDERRKAVAQQLLEKQIQIQNATDARNKADRDYKTAFEDRSKYSLEELADMGRTHWQNRQRETYAEMTAVDIQSLEKKSKEARLYGNTDYANDLQNRALELRKSLSGVLQSGDSDPLKDLRDSSEKAQKHLDDLVTLAAGKGIKVKADD